MWNDIWISWLAWIVVLVAIVIPSVYIYCRMDKRQLDGPRCRRCGYDLRATPGETCTDCGAKLAPRGVWPPGKPSRIWLMVGYMIWTWLVIKLGVVGVIAYNHHEPNIYQRENRQDYLLFHYPASGAYESAGIDIMGDKWMWHEGQSLNDTPLKQATIWIYASDKTIAVCTFDPKTGQYTKPIYTFERYLMNNINGSIP